MKFYQTPKKDVNMISMVKKDYNKVEMTVVLVIYLIFLVEVLENKDKSVPKVHLLASESV
jgi:hypothetical protein